ncbi:MAG: helix-turn-helix transcriptional regulator [Prevotella sp.]|jgi:AraC-like DNA-binding protein|nr:helix-turn-helix transcriptional regulator [Prevotella sp.]
MIKKYESKLIIGHSNLHDMLTSQYLNSYSFIFAICIAGEAEVSFLCNKQIFTKGTMTIFSFDTYPTIQHTSNDFEVYYIYMQGDIGEKILYGLPPYFYTITYIHPIVKIDNSAAAIWIDIFNSCYMDVENPYYEQTIVSLLNAFCFFYLRVWEKIFGDNKPLESGINNMQIASKFYQLVANHFRVHRDIEYYADKLCITPGYLSIITKKIGSENPKSAIDYMVISELKHLVLNSEMNINQIAHKLNFTDSSYLCRYFRKHTGMSTSEFRKQNR